MTPRAATLIVTLLLLSSSSSAQWKNLKILPPTISKDELKSVMKAQAKALGVECDYCHHMPNTEFETEKKKLAREMMRMVSELNSQFLRNRPNKVGCATCHRGKRTPDVVTK